MQQYTNNLDEMLTRFAVLKPAMDPRVFGMESGRFALWRPRCARDLDKHGPNWTEDEFLVLDESTKELKFVIGYQNHMQVPAAAWKLSFKLQDDNNNKFAFSLWNDLGTTHTGRGPVFQPPPTILARHTVSGAVTGVPVDTAGYETEWFYYLTPLGV